MMGVKENHLDFLICTGASSPSLVPRPTLGLLRSNIIVLLSSRGRAQCNGESGSRPILRSCCVAMVMVMVGVIFARGNGEVDRRSTTAKAWTGGIVAAAVIGCAGVDGRYGCVKLAAVEGWPGQWGGHGGGG